MKTLPFEFALYPADDIIYPDFFFVNTRCKKEKKRRYFTALC